MGQGDAALPADSYRQRALRCLAQREHLLLSPLSRYHPVKLPLGSSVMFVNLAESPPAYAQYSHCRSAAAASHEVRQDIWSLGHEVKSRHHIHR